MPVIDSDAHVVESDRTWDFMDPSDMLFRPTLMGSVDSGRQFWFIDGKIRGLARSVLSPKKLEDISEATGRNVVTTQAARDMEDIEGRLQHMDELEVDIQVLHSTIFIQQIADRPEVEVAVCRGYNRWLADIWRQGKGRLRWSATLPFMAMDEAVKELRTAVENGACAALMRPIEGDRLPTDPYFFPIYEEASRRQGVTGENMLRFLELRLDNVVYRAGMAATRAQARQLVNHGHVDVNGRRVDIPSYRCKKGDVVALRAKARKMIVVQWNIDVLDRQSPAWLEMGDNGHEVTVHELPVRDQIDVPVREQLIVELYSK